MTPSKPREKFRLSADPADKGFRANAPLYEALLDGVLEPLCITADEDLGWMLCADPARPHDPGARIEKTGTVQIRRKQP